MTDAEKIQAGAAIASLLVAFAAVIVAFKAHNVAQDANSISKKSSATAEAALVATRRQTALAAVPHLTVKAPYITEQGNFEITVENGGPTVAYGVIAVVAVAKSRSIDDIDVSTLRASGRSPAFSPNADPLYRTVSGDSIVRMDHPARPIHEWTLVRLEYHSPLGATVRQHYLWDGKAKWRLHRMRIDPGPDAGDPIEFDVELGPGDDEPQGQPAFISMG